MPQAHRRPRLILNLSEQPDSDRPSVNDTTDRESAPESLQFGQAFPHIQQAVWGADPVQGPFRVSKLDIRDAFHRGTIKSAQVGAFAYVILFVPRYKGIIICINLAADGCGKCPGRHIPPCPVLRCNLRNPSNQSGSPSHPREPHPYRFYMDDVISVVQGGAYLQHQVFDGTVCALKWLFPSLPGELKDSVSVKKIVVGEGEWICVKEVLG